MKYEIMADRHCKLVASDFQGPTSAIATSDLGAVQSKGVRKGSSEKGSHLKIQERL